MSDRRILLRNHMEKLRCIRNAPINNPDQATNKSVIEEKQQSWLERARRNIEEALVNAQKYYHENGLKNNRTSSSAHHSTAKENVPAVPRPRLLSKPKNCVPAVASAAGTLPASTSAKAPDQDATVLELDTAGFPSRTTETRAATNTTTKSNGNNSQASSCAKATTSAARKARPSKVTKSSTRHSLKPGLKQVNILERFTVKTLDFTRRRRSNATIEVRNHSKIPRHSDKGKFIPVANLCSDSSASADKRPPIDGDRKLQEDCTVVIVEDESSLAEFFDSGAEEDVGVSVEKPQATASCSLVYSDTTQRSQMESEDQTRRMTRSMLAKTAIPRVLVKANYPAKVSDKAKPCDGEREDRSGKIAIPRAPVRANYPAKVADKAKPCNGVREDRSGKIAIPRAPVRANYPAKVADKAKPCDGVREDRSGKIAIPRAPVKANYSAKVADKAKPCNGVREGHAIVFVANGNNVKAFSNGSAQANFSGINIVIQPVVTVAPPTIVGNTIIAGAEQGLQCFGLRQYGASAGRLEVGESAVTKKPVDSIPGLSSCFQNMSLSSGLIMLGASGTAVPPAPAAGVSGTALQYPQLAECNSASQGKDVPADSLSSKLGDDPDESFTVETLEQLVNALGINEYVQSPAVTPSSYALASAGSLVGGTASLLAQDSSAAQRGENCAESIESGASVSCGVIKLAQESDTAAPEMKPEPQLCSGHQPRTNAKGKPGEDGTVKEPLAGDRIQGEACSKNVELSDEDDDDCVIVGVSYTNVAESHNSSSQVDPTAHAITQRPDGVAPLAESSSHLGTKPGQLYLDCQADSGGKDLSEAGFVQVEGSLKTAESTTSLSKNYTTAGESDISSAAGAAVSTATTSNNYSIAVGEREAVTTSISPASETAQDLHLAWQGQPGAIAKIDSTALSSSVPCEGLTFTSRKDGVAESSDDVDLSPSISTTMQGTGAVTASARNNGVLVADTEEDVESHEQCAPATVEKDNALEDAARMHLSKDDCVQELGCSKTVQPLNIEEKDNASDAESVETDVAECFNISNVERNCSSAMPEPSEEKSRTEGAQGLVAEVERGLELNSYCPPEAVTNNNPPEDCTSTKLSKGGSVEELGNLSAVEPFNNVDNDNTTFAGVDRNVAERLGAAVEVNQNSSSAMQGPDQCHIMINNDQITTTGLELPSYGHCLPEPVTRSDFTEDAAAEELSEGDSTKVFSTLKPLDPFNTEAHITQYFQNVVGVGLGHNTVTEAPKVLASCDKHDSSTDTMTRHKLQVQAQCQAETVARTNSLEHAVTEKFSEDDCVEEPGPLEAEPLNSAHEVTTPESTANSPEDTVAKHFGYSAVTEVPEVVALCDKHDSSTDTIRLQVHAQCEAETVTDCFENTTTEQFSEDDYVEGPGTWKTEPLNREDKVTIAESVAMVAGSNSSEDTVTRQLSEVDCIEEPETLETESFNDAGDSTIAESIDSDTTESVDSVEANPDVSPVFPEPSTSTLSAQGVNSLLLETAQELYPLWQGPLETTTKYASSGDGVIQEPWDRDCTQKVDSLKNVESSDSVNNDDLTTLENKRGYDRSPCQKVDSSKNDELTPTEKEWGNTKWAWADESVGTVKQEPQNETLVAEDDSNLIGKTNEELQSCSQCPLETGLGSNLPEESVATEFLESDCIQEKTADPLIIASRDNSAISDGNKNGATEPGSNAFDVNCGSSTVMPDLIASTEDDSCTATETGQQSQSHEPHPAKTRAESSLCENMATKCLPESDHIRELGHLKTVDPLNCPTEDPRTVAEEQEEDVAESPKSAVEVDSDFSTVTLELEAEMSLTSDSEDFISESTPELNLQCPPGTITRSNSPEGATKETSQCDHRLEAIALNEAKDMSSEHDRAVEDAFSDSVMKEPSKGDQGLEVSASNEAKDMSSEHCRAVEDTVSDSVTKEPSQGDCTREVGAFVEVENSSHGDYNVAEDGGAVSKSSNDGVNARQFSSVVQQPDVATLPAKNSSISQTSEMGQKSPIQRHCHPDVNKQETTGPLNCQKDDDGKAVTADCQKAIAESSIKAVDVDDLPSPMQDSGTKTSLAAAIDSLVSEIAPESCLGCPARTIARSNLPEDDITKKPSQTNRDEEVSCVKKVKSSSSENNTVVNDTVSELSNGIVDTTPSVNVEEEQVTAVLPSRQTETEKALFWLMPSTSSKSSSLAAEAGQEPVLCGQHPPQVKARGSHDGATVTAEPSKHEGVRKFCSRNVKCVVVASSLGCDDSSIVGGNDGSVESPSKDVEADHSAGKNVRELGLASHFEDGDNLIPESGNDSELCRLREPETAIGSKSDENTFVKELSDGGVKEPCSFKALEPLSINEKCVTVTESDESEASKSFNDSAGITLEWNSAVLDFNATPSCDNHSPITKTGQELKSYQQSPKAITESVLSEDGSMSEESKSEGSKSGASNASNDRAVVTHDLNSTVLEDVDATALDDNRSPITRTGQELQSYEECPEAITESVLSEEAAVSKQSKGYPIQEPVGLENVRSSSSMDENGSLLADNTDGHAKSSIDGIRVDQGILSPEPDAASHAMDGSSAVSEASQELQLQTPCQHENIMGNGLLEDFSSGALSRSEGVEAVLSCQPETNGPCKDAFTGELSRSKNVEEVWSDRPGTMMENRSSEGALTEELSRISSAGEFASSDSVKPAAHSRIAGEDCVAVARCETEPGRTHRNSSDTNCGVDDAVVPHPNSETLQTLPHLGSAAGRKRKKRHGGRRHRCKEPGAWQSNPPADTATKCPPRGDYTKGVRVCFDYSNNLHVTVVPQGGSKFAPLSDSVAEANRVTDPITEESDATSLCAGAGSSAVSGAEQDSQRHRPKRIAKRRSPKAAARDEPSNHDCAAGPSGHPKTTQRLEGFSGAVYEPHMGRHVVEKEIVPDSQDFGVSAVRYRISWLPAQFL